MVSVRKGLGKLVKSIKNIGSDAADYSARKQFDRSLSKITSGTDEDRVTAIKSLVAQVKANPTLAEQVVDNLIASLNSSKGAGASNVVQMCMARVSVLHTFGCIL